MGPVGPVGSQGRSVEQVAISGDGRLLFEWSDGEVQNAGLVMGLLVALALRRTRREGQGWRRWHRLVVWSPCAYGFRWEASDTGLTQPP